MIVATRILNFVSAVFILATGICVELKSAGLLPEAVRMLIGTAAIGYFWYRVYGMLASKGTPVVEQSLHR
ncbi:MAG: hypothetical protein DRP45_04470 [Candidatus Zixiibacteriota bacterium]|nr:MAG: hypothetical protein DRP45_04470 [candidate division Zixibacteria bacterium]